MYICVVCGYNNLQNKQYSKDGLPMFVICPCCGFESGFDDLSEGYSIEEYRFEWLMNGAKWWSGAQSKPDNWDAKTQMIRSGIYELSFDIDIDGFACLDSYMKRYKKDNINRLSKYGRSDLHRAVYQKKYDIAEFLINEGIYVNLADPRRKTALHLAVRNRAINITRMLVEHGADINSKDKLEQTPLFIAVRTMMRLRRAENEVSEIVELLLDYGADTNVEDINGISVLDLAKKKNNKKLLELFDKDKHT